MPDADMALDEKRVHGEHREATRAVVASGLGLATVDVSDDQIGRFGLAHRCVARDVAGDGRLAVATDGDVLVGDTEVLESTGFGPAVAVGFDRESVGTDGDTVPVAADAGGRIARRGGAEWTTVSTLDAAIRAIEGDLVAAADGVYRIGRDLTLLGLDDVRDVAAAGTFAATADGVHRRVADGWTREREGDATVVAIDEARDGDRAHAIVDGTLLERRVTPERDGAWADADCPATGVVAIAHADGTYAVTVDGQFLVDASTSKDGAGGWRSRSLGLSDVAGLAVV